MLAYIFEFSFLLETFEGRIEELAYPSIVAVSSRCPWKYFGNTRAQVEVTGKVLYHGWNLVVKLSSIRSIIFFGAEPGRLFCRLIGQ